MVTVYTRNMEQLTHVPEDLFSPEFEAVEEVDLDANLIQEIDVRCKNLTKLTKLSMRLVSKLEFWILTVYSFYRYNKLKTVPATLSPTLLNLDLFSNKLSSLPKDFGNYKNLVKLNLRFNEISKFPSSFSELGSLTFLNLDSNRFSSFPTEVLFLTSLFTSIVLGGKQGNIINSSPNFQTPEFEKFEHFSTFFD
eukprot:TRINITY_DN2077_c0_g1_i16.p1 TRINITY_DN2077_c0_g1~~TRINITY_DN2077_c0_g1_i16.p1  ORF type:complete len:194 (-),score=37.15 TRINITY_DN2077_c0_g1_i16:67-648(-)